MRSLLEDLESYEQNPRASTGKRLAGQFQSFADSEDPRQQALARQVELYYRNTNFRFSMTAELLRRLLPEPASSNELVRDTILGRPVSGRSNTHNSVSVQFVPDEHCLRMVLEARGQTTSATSSSAGLVTLFSRSTSEFSVRKLLELGPTGLRIEPARAEVASQVRLRGASSDLDDLPLIGSLVRSYAVDQYAQQRAAARREVEFKVARRAEQALDAMVGARIHQLRLQANNHLFLPLSKLALSPAVVEARGTGERLTMRARVATGGQLAAFTPRPRALEGSLASLQVHESVFNNVLEQLELNGRTFSGEELYRLIADKLGWDVDRSSPRETGLTTGDATNDGPSPGSNDSTLADLRISFPPHDALQVRCMDGRIELAISLAELESGSQRWRDFQVYVSYRPQTAGRGVQLVRDGVVGLTGRLSMRSQMILRGTFSRIFSPQRSLAIPTESLASDPRLAGLRIEQFELTDGWIGLSVIDDAVPVVEDAMADRPKPDRPSPGAR
jgi:hypothetical protein